MRRVAGVLALLITSPAWAADPPRQTPAEDLKAMQGIWRVSTLSPLAMRHPPEAKSPRVPTLLERLGVAGAELTIDGNRLNADDETAHLANDLSLPDEQERVERSVRGNRLALLTLPTGRGLFVSYSLKGNSLTLRYPAGACSRSGAVIGFDRVRR